MSADLEQIKDLANTIALQAEAIAQGKIPEAQLHAQASLLHNNTKTLKAWVPTPPEKPAPYYPGYLDHVAGQQKEKS